MASEENYLDDLLKNVIGDEPKKERTMQDVMREMGMELAEPAPTPETPAEPASTPETPAEPAPTPETPAKPAPTPDIPVEPSADFSSEPEISLDADYLDPLESEPVSDNLTFPDQDVLADMLDILDNPMTFAEEVKPAEAPLEDDIGNMLESVPGIIEEPIAESVPEEPDPLQSDLESMLDGIEENYNLEASSAVEQTLEGSVAEEIPVAAEIPSPEETFAAEMPVEEMPSQDDLAAMLEGLEEPSAEEPAAEEIPLGEVPTQDDLSAMLEGLEEPSVEEPVAEEIPVEEPAQEPEISSEDIEAMLAAAEEISSADEMPAEETFSQDDLAAMLEGLEEPSVEEPAIEEPAAEELPVEEPAEEAPAEEAASQDDLAAMLEGMGGSDPNAKMSPDDIAAMFAAAEGASAPAEEPAVEEPAAEEIPVEEPVEEAPAEEAASQDDLAAMLEGIDESSPDGTPGEEGASSDDDLLKMLAEATTAEDFEMPADRLPNDESSDNIDLSQDDIETLISGEDITSDSETQDDLEAMLAEAGEDVDTSSDSQDDLEAMLAEAGVDSDSSSDSNLEEDASQDDLEAMLAAADLEGSEGADASEGGELSQDDLEAMLGGIDMGSEGETSPEEMSDVEKLAATEGSDEDLLSLLEGIDETASEEASEGLPVELSGVIEEGEETEDKGKKKKKFSLAALLPFGKKKKKKDESEEETEEPGEQPIEASPDKIDDILTGIEEAGEEGAEDTLSDEEALKELELASIPEKKKKNGLFAKIMSFLFDEVEEEEEIVAEVSNEDILAEIDAENAEAEQGKGKKGKKAKKDKKKKGKKGGDEEAKEGSEESESGEGEEDSKKKKKPKKEKAPKEPKPKEPRKVVLSKKAFIALVACCASIIAAIVIISNILPDHSDKLLARRAYFNGDYRTVYDNLYGKRLNDSDYLMYKKAETILLMQRRLDSYRNRLLLNEPAQALDSLLEGVHLYDILTEEDRYGVNKELQPIYENILQILSTEYGISRDEALMLYSMEDSEAYTEELIKIVSGGQYTIQGKNVSSGENPEAPENAEGLGEPGPAPEGTDPSVAAPPDAAPPEDAPPAPENEQEAFNELHPLDDLLEAEEDL
ncbi:MAG: hypothetical protein K5888_04390 [Lachnospiraceae bacterium]|nr:hypothetical protein [Lachnospiraceae bacterium]